MKKFIPFYFLFIFLNTLKAQDSIAVSADANIKIDRQTYNSSSYHISFKKDAPVLIAGIGLTYLGNNIIKNKKPLTQTELATKTIDKIPFFDRGNAGYYSDKINKDSYIPMFVSYSVPLVMTLINKNERTNAGKILLMYLESEAITGALYTIPNGSLDRPRPLVYGTTAPLDERLNKNNQRSFYAGHTASSATATFFAAKVFQDLNPNSKAKPYVWAVAAALPAVVGYMRYKSGFHFLSDNIIGYAIGAATGILVPQWHKTKHENVSLLPQYGKDYKGIAILYKIK